MRVRVRVREAGNRIVHVMELVMVAVLRRFMDIYTYIQ